MEADIQILQGGSVRIHTNLILDYLNINSLLNRVADLRVIMKDLSLHYFILNETKLEGSFPTTQFYLKE